MDLIERIALAELEQHTAHARSMGYLGPAAQDEVAQPAPVVDTDDISDVPFWD